MILEILFCLGFTHLLISSSDLNKVDKIDLLSMIYLPVLLMGLVELTGNIYFFLGLIGSLFYIVFRVLYMDFRD